jgi:hypothetical protein
MDRIVRQYLAVLAIALAMTSTAMTSTALAQAQTVDPKACSEAARNSSGQSLSDKLNQSNGVICPPNVDPGIKAPTPPAGKTPVIPPPGSPGGDPSVQPK